MQIVPYKKEFRKDFEALNLAWLKRFYWIEPCDRDQIENVEKLIEGGGMVFFAVEEGEVLATCMTIPLPDGSWELCKFAAKGQYTGTGAGTAVFKACMDYALGKGAVKLVLVSCSGLKHALGIYRKLGFKEVSLEKERWGAEKADMQMEYRTD